MMVQIQFKEHLRIIGVVHVVVDGVNATARASVTTSRATTGGRSFRRGIGDLVTRSAAAALEGMVKTDPVSGLVCQSLIARKL